MSELNPCTMTDDERLKLIAWLESRAQGSTMPGASRMYKLALDAIRAQPANEPLTLPCAVGTALFGVTMGEKHIVPFIADEFIWSNNHWFIMGQHGEGEFDWVDCYTTNVAAEQALAARKPEGSAEK